MERGERDRRDKGIHTIISCNHSITVVDQLFMYNAITQHFGMVLEYTTLFSCIVCLMQYNDGVCLFPMIFLTVLPTNMGSSSGRACKVVPGLDIGL